MMYAQPPQTNMSYMSQSHMMSWRTTQNQNTHKRYWHDSSGHQDDDGDEDDSPDSYGYKRASDTQMRHTEQADNSPPNC